MINLSPDIIKKLIISVGTHFSNRSLSPIEVALIFDEALKSGAERQELSSLCNINITMISRFIKLLSLPESMWHLIDWGNNPSGISFSVAYQVAGLNDKVGQEEIISSILEYRLTRLEVQDTVQVIKRAKVNATEAVQRTLKLRKAIEKLHLFIGQIILTEVRDALCNLSQPDRDNLLKSAFIKYHNDLPIEGAKLGTKRFSILVQENFASKVINLKEGFEIAINNMLKKEVNDRLEATN